MSEERSVEEVLAEASELFERKNEDYADSWRLTGETMALWLEHEGVDELTLPTDDPAAFIAFGLYTRRLDKMVRSFMQGLAQMDGDTRVDESIIETTEDQVPYAAMQTVIAEEMSGEE